jgi:polyisoprenoid-binding protein YceI
MRWLLFVVWLAGLTACAAPADEPAQPSEVAPAQPTESPRTPAPAGDQADNSVFQIQAAESEARFVIGEILGGQPNTVIGVNSSVQGEITLNWSNPAASQIGPLEIAADGFVTDSHLRTRAIRPVILESDAHPVITFGPATITGLPDTAVVGETVQLEIAGDLTIREVTQPVTFAAQVTLAAEDRLEGSATATIQRADFDLTIPSVPRVAGVDEAVALELDFVAVAQ